MTQTINGDTLSDFLREKLHDGSVRVPDLVWTLRQARFLSGKERIKVIHEIAMLSAGYDEVIGDNCGSKVYYEEVFRLFYEEPEFYDNYLGNNPNLEDRFVIADKIDIQNLSRVIVGLSDLPKPREYILTLENRSGRIYTFHNSSRFEHDDIAVKLPNEIIANLDERRDVLSGISRSAFEYSGVICFPSLWKPYAEYDPSWDFKFYRPEVLDRKEEKPLLVKPKEYLKLR